MHLASALFVLFAANFFSGTLARTPAAPIRHDAPTLALHSSPTRYVHRDLRARSIGLTSVALASDENSYYTVLSVGDIYFRVALDTGSSDLWILSSNCSESTCKNLPTYPLTYQSPSFVSVNNNNTAFNISFADGTSSSGFVALESVSLQNFTVPKQAFGLVTLSNVALDDAVSGILGLGFPRLSSISALAANTTPFISTLAQQGNLSYPLFGLSLTRNASGTLSLGAIDASVVKNASDIEWHEVVPFAPFAGTNITTSSYLQWALPLTAVSVNGTSIVPIPTYPNFTAGTSVALLDVGTNGFFGPFQDVSRIFNLLNDSRLVDESGIWALPCDTGKNMSFSFGQQNFTLQPTDYLIGPIDGDPDVCLSWPRALPPSADGIDWQLGTPFLRTVYSIFSYGIDTKEPPMIGLYALNNASAPIESAANISSIFASESATIATTLPNFPLSTPTSFSTPTYLFNSSLALSATAGLIVSSDLGTSTYSPILLPAVHHDKLNASLIPTILPAPTVVTITLTNSGGAVVTETSTSSPVPTQELGKPPGWSAGVALRVPEHSVLISVSLSLSLLLYFTAVMF